MADLDTDFEFDDDGIYREKAHLASTDAAMLVDEHGIWRDATEDESICGDAAEQARLRSRDSGMGSSSAWPQNVHNHSDTPPTPPRQDVDDTVVSPRAGSIAYLLKSNIAHNDDDDEDDNDEDDDVVNMDSSQEEMQHNSLAEFETLEARVDSPPDADDKEDFDVVGTYLRGLQELDDAEQCAAEAGDHWAQRSTEGWVHDSLLQPTKLPSASGSPHLDPEQSHMYEANEEQTANSFDLTAGSPLADISQLTQIPVSRLSSASQSCMSPHHVTTARSQRSTATSESGRSLPATPQRSTSHSESPRYSAHEPSDAINRAAALLEDATLDDLVDNPDVPAIVVVPPNNNLKRANGKVLPESLRVRTGNGTGAIPQPLRAPPHGVSTTPRLAKHQENEETLNQLQIEYNTLLKKYAEAENTIDELRLGAKVNLYSDSPVPSQAMTGSLAPSQHAQSFSIARLSNASLSNLTPQAAKIGSAYESRPDSRASQLSGSMWSNRENGVDEMGSSMSLVGDSAKLSLLAKAKAIQEQTGAFHILLTENQLTLEDQERALENIKSGCEQLQQQYRDTKHEQQMLMRQNGSTTNGATACDMPFDDDKVLEGELYKLNMRLDDLEHTVQRNVRCRSVKRVPFQTTPLKADHSVDVDGMAGSRSALDSLASSMQGSAESLDQQLHGLQKAYGALIDRYQRVKQMHKSPERDAHLDHLLQELREVYEKTPEHRKPVLPPELENHINGTHGEFTEPSQSLSSQNGDILPSSSVHQRGAAQNNNSDQVTCSEISSDANKVDFQERSLEYGTGRPEQRRSAPINTTTSDADSSTTTSLPGTTQTWRRRAQLPTPNQRPAKGRLGGRSSFGWQPGRLADREDSGYVGSVSSRRGGLTAVTPARIAGQSRATGQILPGQQQQHSGGMASGRPPGHLTGHYGGRQTPESSDSESGASTVEERVKPYRPLAAANLNTTAAAATMQSKTELGLRNKGSADFVADRRSVNTANSRQSPRMLTSEVASMPTHDRDGARDTTESAQLRTLQKEMANMKVQLARTNGMPSASVASIIQPHPIQAQPLQPTLLQNNQQNAGNPYELQAVYPGGTYPYYSDGIATVPQGGVLYNPPAQPAPYGLSVPRPYDAYTQEGPITLGFDPGMMGGGDPYTEHKFERRSSTYGRRDCIRDPYHGAGQPAGYDNATRSRYSSRTSAPGFPRSDRSNRHDDGYYVDGSWPREDAYDSEPDRDTWGHDGYDSDGEYPERNRTRNGSGRRDDWYGGNQSTPYTRARMYDYDNEPTPSGYDMSASRYQQPPIAACSTCGGTGYRNHKPHAPACGNCGGAGYHQPHIQPQPATTATFTPTPWVGGPAPAASMQYVVGVPPSNVTANSALPVNGMLQNGQNLVPCQLLPVGGCGVTPADSVKSNDRIISTRSRGRQRVRYYVREYGTDSESDMNTRNRLNGRCNNLHKNHSSSETLQKDSAELDDSLRMALQTAKHLKKVSSRMRQSLHSELNRYHHEAPLISGY